MLSTRMSTSAPKPKFLQECFEDIPDDDRVAIIYESSSGVKQTLSYKELDELAYKFRNILKPLEKSTRFVGVICRPGLYLPSILLGILRAGLGYYCFDHRSDLSDSQSLITTLEMNTFVIDCYWMRVHGHKYPELVPLLPSRRPCLDKASIDVCRTDSFRHPFKSKIHPGVYPWAYACRTSGTTGNRKIVLVPHSAIVPNILDFVRIEKIEENDVLFGASPPTFDPFNVDLFSTLKKRAKLLIVSESVKLNPSKLALTILINHVSIIHCTPSLLLRFGDFESSLLFSSESSLRVLALGGERCLEKEHLRRLVPREKRPEVLVLNLYGTTEVSCWASVDIIDLENDDPISIGQPLSETEVGIFDNDCTSQIHIGSYTRMCSVLNEFGVRIDLRKIVDGMPYTETGDVGETSEDHYIVFSGRLDRMIKRRGHFVNLTDIENRVLLTNLVSLAATFYFFGRIFLVVKFKTDFSETFELERGKEMLGKSLEKYLPIQYYPDKIIVISDDVPVTRNGKLDMSYIKDLVRAEQYRGINDSYFCSPIDCLQINYPPDDVDDFILTTWKNNTGNRKDFHSSDTFFEAGGNSARAVRFVEEVMQGLLKFGTKIHADEEITFLNTLNRSSFDVVRKYVFKSICENEPHMVEVSSLGPVEEIRYLLNKSWLEPGFKRVPLSALTTTEQKIEDISLTLQIPIASREWTIDLLGCVDATPVILANTGFRCKGRIVLVGSHSGYLGAVNLEVLRETRISDAESCILWRRKFPDRIATTAGYHTSQLFAFIICCDETMYTICVETGAIRWLYHINGLIRSPPVCNQDGTVVYLLSAFPNGQLTALNFEDGLKLWSTSLAFVVSPLSIRVNDAGIFVTSTDVAVIKFAHGGDYMHCRGDVERACTPPLIMELESRNLILVGTLNGTLVTYDENLMQMIWTFYGPEDDPVNPIHFHECDTHPGLVIYTTHSGVLRVLDANDGSLRQKLKLRIESRSVPSCFTNLNIENAGGSTGTSICCAVITDVVGGLHFVNIDSGKKIGVIQPTQTMECFSSAVVCGDLVAFGGRSNKLHIIQLKDVRAQGRRWK